MIDANDGLAMDEGIDMTPLPASPPSLTETRLPAMKTIATVTPIVITEIKPVQRIPSKIESKKSVRKFLNTHIYNMNPSTAAHLPVKLVFQVVLEDSKVLGLSQCCKGKLMDKLV